MEVKRVAFFIPFFFFRKSFLSISYVLSFQFHMVFLPLPLIFICVAACMHVRDAVRCIYTHGLGNLICPIDEGGTFALVCRRAFIEGELGTLPGTPGQQAACGEGRNV